jgi:riboflavin kinase, archaea type
MKVLIGRVVSAIGDFSYWIEKLQDYYYRKIELRLFPRTLNIELGYHYSLTSEVIRLEKEEYGGTVSVNILPCKIFGRKAVILRTDTNESGQGEHPKNIIEVACEVKLRDQYNLKDGDVVEVEVPG